MVITCGPIEDKRDIKLVLPSDPTQIGVMVSGGIDSALLLYLVYLQNIFTGNKHDIRAYTVARKEGAKYFACAVVEQIQRSLGIPPQKPFMVGDATVYEPLQVTTGMIQAVRHGCSEVYLGVIEQQPEHLLGWKKIQVTPDRIFKYPLMHVTKSHIIDAVCSVNQQSLFHITHSCDSETDRCGLCNGCRERAWGFSMMNVEDPGFV